MESVNDSQENKNAVQDRKLMWKLVKEKKKEAKKKKKEEEFLANLRRPKDTKVVLADKSFVEKLRNQNVPSRAKRAPGFLAQDFPALAAKFPKPPPKSQEPTGRSKGVDNSAADSACTIVQETAGKGVERENNCGDPSSIAAAAVTDNIPPEPEVDEEQVGVISTAPLTPKKRTKKNDPVVLYSHDLISKSPKKERKNLAYEMKHRRKPERVLCGNMLDSSNPIRKRGKHREIKKLKLSKLKFAILTDRILKQKGRNNSDGGELMDRKQLKIDIDEYLSNLTKTKLELAEKQRKKSEENKTEQITPGEMIPTESKERNVKKKPTKYRKYCDNRYSEGLDESVKHLITSIIYMQDRAFNKDATKAHAKQRHVVGFREVKKYLTLKKIKMVVVAPDLEGKDAVTNMVEELKKIASLQNVPCVFALSRRLLGFATKKVVPVSAFGIMNYDGMEDTFAVVKEKLKEAQDKYKLKEAQNELKLNNCKIENTNGKALEVTSADENIKNVSSNKAVNTRKENEPDSHQNRKKRRSKTKHVQQLEGAHTNTIVDKRLIDSQENV